MLCPGVALPLHVFEERYRLMIARCIEATEPFGVVLIRDGREVGQLTPRLAGVGTTAMIRQASRYPDGRLDIVTVGGRRFRIASVDEAAAPYLVGQVDLLGEPLGSDAEAEWLSERVSARFMQYLELLQTALAGDDGPEIEIEVEIETDEDAIGQADPASPDPEAAGPHVSLIEEMADTGPADAAHVESLSDEERRNLLMAAARRLTETGDPTSLSYVLTGLVQVELSRRQDLLEKVDTVSRLRALRSLLGREVWLLERGLKPFALDPRHLPARHN